MAAFYENKQIPVDAHMGSTLTEEPHLHDHLEMVYLRNGCSGTVCDDHRGTIYPGDVFLSFPNQIHSYPHVGDGTGEHLILVFSSNVCNEFKDLFHRMSPISPIVRAKDLDGDIPKLMEKIIEEKETDSPYREAIIQGYLLSLLGKLFRSMEFREEKQSDGSLLKSILNYCNNHYTEDLSLEILSRELNTGKYHISHIFSEKLKISFPDYVNGLRINDAIRQLTTDPDRTITAIAYDCGFNSTRTFNRAFAKYTGMAPRDYREENLYKNLAPMNFYISQR